MPHHAALIFPGQGAQRVGMGREFYETSEAARTIFDQADRLLGNDLKSVIFEGPPEKLTQTAFCQPAILTVSVAALKALQAHPQFQNLAVRFAAGLSLGEYSALVAAGALTFEDALRLVERRAFFMEEAARLAQGTMAAVIGFDRDRLLKICSETGAEVANFNSPEQIVITGGLEKVREACRRIQAEGPTSAAATKFSGISSGTSARGASPPSASRPLVGTEHPPIVGEQVPPHPLSALAEYKTKESCKGTRAEDPARGAKSVIPLEVSGAFHSSLMQPAARKFEGELKKVSFQSCRIPVVSNVHAQPHRDPDSIRRDLARQIVSSVRWEESVRTIASQGITDFIEIGPGKVLKGLVRRIDPSLRVCTIERPEDIEGLPF